MVDRQASKRLVERDQERRRRVENMVVDMKLAKQGLRILYHEGKAWAIAARPGGPIR